MKKYKVIGPVKKASRGEAVKADRILSAHVGFEGTRKDFEALLRAEGIKAKYSSAFCSERVGRGLIELGGASSSSRLIDETTLLEGEKRATTSTVGNPEVRKLELGGANRPDAVLPEEVLSSSTFPEGAVERILVNRYERDPRAREACIREYGTLCCICKFNFVEKYTELMTGFIHVHHLKSLATLGADYWVCPVQDLRPVCPNCHAVLHRKDPPYSIEEVVEFMRLARAGR